MLAVANNIKLCEYKDILCNLVDKTGVNSTAEKVIVYGNGLLLEQPTYIYSYLVVRLFVSINHKPYV